MWQTIFLVAIILAIVSIVYIVFRFHSFSFIKKIGKKHKLISWLLSLCPLLVISCFYLINLPTAVIVMIHLFLAFLIFDFIAFIIRKVSKKQFSYDYQSAGAIMFTVIYLSIGWYMAHHVFQTDYTFYTSKSIGAERLRIVEIADSHLGITLDGSDFAEQMKRVQKTNPDIVTIVGDFVDDDTDVNDMIESCKALGELKTTYGVYFVYGNHDNGYYNYRNFSSKQLRDELTKNNVTILEDESVLVNDLFYIIGRKDAYTPNRLGMDELTADLDNEKYSIVLDHQPNDYANEAAADVDLVMSGHTHGGHLFPAGPIGLLLKANDRIYGTEKRGNTTFVVTSGISGWAIPFKTGTASEFVVIDIKSE